MKTKVDYDILGKFFDYDSEQLEFDRVTERVDSDIDIEYAVDVIFNHYRKYGFPHYKVTEYEKHNHMKKLIKFDHKRILDTSQEHVDGDVIIQTMHCLRLAWNYFPHWVDVRCGSSKMSPIGYFNDDKKLKGIIRKTWKWQQNYGGGKFTENRFRQCLKLYEGSQGVSNFRPTAAKVVYEEYGGDGIVWDMSCGWGGRLIGALSSKRIKKYIGTEPATKTFEGLLKLKEDFSYINKEVELHKLGSEVFRPKEKVDLCFTSPPYFDTEKYSDEDTQSYKKYPEEQKWIDGFLFQTIKNCYESLKKNGYLLLNIANTSSGKSIEKATLDISKGFGLVHEKTLQLTLSSVMGAGYKYEPIYVFKKSGE